MAKPLSEIWFLPMTAGQPVRVGLKADGSADLSGLPDDIRRNLEDFGVRDEMHRGQVKASEGSRFLTLLLASSNGYARFEATQSAA